jgi:peptidoglycan/LPS O-acetylase OafA/YrhL
MAYYLFWPAALWLSGYRTTHASTGAAVIALMLACVVYFLDRYSGSRHLVGVWMLLYMSILWFAGALVAAKWDYLKQSNLLRALSWLWLPGLALVFLFEYQGLIQFHVRNLALGPIFIALLLNLRSWPDWLLEHKVRTDALGNISYPLYLFHGPLLVLMGSFMLFAGLTPAFSVAFFALLLTSVILGGLFCIPLEVRLMTWRKKYLNGFSRAELARIEAGESKDL